MGNENDQLDNFTPDPNFNPLRDNVNERDYTAGNYEATAEELSQSIPVPQTGRGRTTRRENPYEQITGENGGNSGGGGSSAAPPVNPSLNNIPDPDKKLAASHLAKMIVDGYEQVHVFANKALQFPERKLRKLEAEGEIDLSVQIPYDYGKTISAGEFVKDFNHQNEDTLTVSKEFKKEVTPVLTRVLEKHGAGITDEQLLVYMFGKDIAVKAVIATQIRGTMNDMIEVIKEYTLAVKTGGYTAPKQQQAASHQTTPDYTPEPERKEPVYNTPEPDLTDPAFNFNNNETVMNSLVQKMEVPQTGRQRAIDQIKKEKNWKDGQPAKTTGSAYQAAMKNKKGQGRGNRKPKDYIPKLDPAQIAENLALNESANMPSKEKDPLED